MNVTILAPGHRRDFVHGEDVTIADWAISTEGPPRHEETKLADTDPSPSGRHPEGTAPVTS
ncbi:hypothetical protein [Streptomyces echinatus]|uniref:hypothetical protein n=1 Tax=Streptomyces echinatus TaxID=67293 RepID=UPI003792644B